MKLPLCSIYAANSCTALHSFRAVAPLLSLVDYMMAIPLGAGSVSALHYGTKVTALIIGTGSLAVGTTVLPYFSQMTAQQDWRALRHTLRTYSRLVLAGTLLVTAVV